MGTQALFMDTVGVLAVITMIPVFFVWLEKKTRWKIFDYLPAIIWIFITPILLSNLPLFPKDVPVAPDGTIVTDVAANPDHELESRLVPVIPRSTPVYSVFKGFAVPMFIVLMLLDINIRQAVRVAWRGVGVLVFGAFGIVFGATTAFYLLRSGLPPDTWRGFGALAGSWIGGTGNLAAVAESLKTPQEMVGVVVVVDNLVYLVYFPIILTCKRWAASFNRFTRVNEAEVEQIADSVGELETKSKEVHFKGLLTLVGWGFTAIVVARLLAGLLPEWGAVFTESTWAMLLVTTFGIILSASPLKNIPGSDALSMTFVYIYMTMIGAGADLRGLAGAQWFLVAGAMCIVFHFVFIVAAARIFRVDVSMAAVASVAAVGGAASAPVAAGYHRENLVPVSIMLALIGYGLGNYLGVLTATLCELVS